MARSRLDTAQKALRVFLLVWLMANVARAAPSMAKAMEEYDEQITAELRATSPSAAASFEQANRARSADDHPRAAELYAKVLEEVPTFNHARRRLCGEKRELGQRDEALVLCRQAAEDGKSPNLASLAALLISPGPGKSATLAEIGEARQLADRAVRAEGRDFFAWLTLCQVAAIQGDDEALGRCTNALEQSAPPDALAAGLALRAGSLLDAAKGEGGPGLERARRLAERAASLAPGEPMPQRILCHAATQQNDVAALERCSGALLRLAPQDASTHVYAAILASSQGRHGDARKALERARALGLGTEQYQSLSRALDEATPFYAGWIMPLLWTLGAWLGGMVLLIIAGLGLSRAALTASRRLPADKSGRASGMSASLRRAYSIVLWLCCGFYYVSLPIVALIVVAAGGALIYATFVIGTIPIKLLIIAAIIVLVTLGSIVKSLFVRVRDEDPGPRLNLGEHPKLANVLAEVAAKIDTRPVDTVFMSPGTHIAVFERGGLAAQIRRRSERCLILGAGVLYGMKLIELKAILAHEYGHFSNRDTAGGGFALAVRRSLSALAVGLAKGGAAVWYSPAWLFLVGFFKLFLRISQGASRLQEVLADRWAAFAYGSAAFVRGLRHVIEQSVLFDAHLNATLSEVVNQQRPLANLYRHEPELQPKKKELHATIEEALEAEPSPYDSHPAPRDRIAWVEALDAPGDAPEQDAELDAWSVFEDRARIEAAMTAEIRARVYEQTGMVVRPE